MEVTFKGNARAPLPPMHRQPVDWAQPFNPGAIFGCCGVCTNGGLPSRDSVFASFPLPWSKKIPYPPRSEVLPSPKISHAKPTRGAGLNKCPCMQPRETPGAPHCTIPLNKKGASAELVGFKANVPVGSKRFPLGPTTGAFVLLQAPDSQL